MNSGLARRERLDQPFMQRYSALSLSRKYVRRLQVYAKGWWRSSGKTKIVCIGLNKTGTTSLAKALTLLGIDVAPQGFAEPLIRDWERRDFRRIIRFCRFFEAFQDVPFSCPFTYQAVDAAFPRSKFILTIRKNTDEWCRSFIRFHSKVFGKGKLPTVDDLKSADYSYPAYAYDLYSARFPINGGSLYDPQMLRDYYDAHNAAVMEYFRHRPSDLLVLEVASGNAWTELCRFLKKAQPDMAFPCENRSDYGVTDEAVDPAADRLNYCTQSAFVPTGPAERSPTESETN